jgi:hypothetical protein
MNIKNIFLGTLLGYISSCISLTIYRYFFGGWTSLFDGTMEPFRSDYIFSNFTDYLFLTIGFLFFGLLLYFIFFKISNMFLKQKVFNIKNIFFPAVYIYIYILYVDIFANISATGPGRPNTLMEIILNFTVGFILPLILNIIYIKKIKNIRLTCNIVLTFYFIIVYNKFMLLTQIKYINNRVVSY